MTFSYPNHFTQITKNFLLLSFLIIITLSVVSCSSAERFTSKEETRIEESGTAVRILLADPGSSYTYVVKNQLIIRDQSKKIAIVKAGNSLQFVANGLTTTLNIGDKTFKSDFFLLENEDNSAITKFNGNTYTGIIKVISSGNKINVINTLSLEEYIKGVLPFEMPVGKGEAYLESFKALAVCIRTYAINRMKEGKTLFDLYADTRDQVYGGSGKGNTFSDRAVNETKGMILTYSGKPAYVFYHSTCGGNTEKADNVFDKKNIPYLQGIVDGESANCKESPRFTWQESYESSLFINRLFNAKLIPDNNFTLKKIHIKSRFDSGRINELQILLSDNNNSAKMISLYGNSMRSVIRTADNSSILRSNSFDVDFNGQNVIIKGRGFGHGVGLCQWGAMHLAVSGKDFREILSHYYPGTAITQVND